MATHKEALSNVLSVTEDIESRVDLRSTLAIVDVIETKCNEIIYEMQQTNKALYQLVETLERKL